MRRDWREQKPASLLRGTEWLRVSAGITMLLVLFMLISRAGDPNTWSWLAPNDSSGKTSNKTESAAAEPGAAKLAKGGAQRSQVPDAVEQKDENPRSGLPPAQDVDMGPTDQDPDEAQEAAMEFQAVTDGTPELQREEMVPYDRIVRWVKNQPFDVLRARARTDLIFTHLYQRPDKYRGQLVALDLNVRQVIDAGENDEGVHLWEVRGWTTESKAWLYWTVVLDLPKHMPVGADVHESARFVGYFFKLQGYYEAGAKPNAPLLKAPLLIGRLEWEPAKARPPIHETPEQTQVWAIVLLACLGTAIGLRFVYQRLRRKPPASTTRVYDPNRRSTMSIEEWLEQPQLAHSQEELAQGDAENDPVGEGEPASLHDEQTARDAEPRDAGQFPDQLDEG